MIEFKADCGHTIRARDEDAGGVVRCSYCGRSAGVPDSADTDLSFLFRDVETPAEQPRKRALFGAFTRKKRSRREFDPFAVIFRLGYIAVLIVVIVVLARKVVLPLLDENVRKERFAGNQPTPSQPGAGEASRSSRLGLIGSRVPQGLIVTSVPTGGRVFCVDETKAPKTGRVSQVSQCMEFRAGDRPPRLSEGTYVLEVAFPWNDPKLSNPSLAHYDKYVAFRRAIEKASDERRRELAKSFFLPDEADDVFVDETVDQIYIVKQYRGVRVEKEGATSVQALFLPRLVSRDDKDVLLLEPLLHGYTSNKRRYRLDEQHVRGELSFYGVPAADQLFVVEFLARVGAAPYVTPSDGVRLFKIDPLSGNISARLLESTPP